jgi:hypothetical protein
MKIKFYRGGFEGTRRDLKALLLGVVILIIVVSAYLYLTAPNPGECALHYTSVGLHAENNRVVFGPGSCGTDYDTTAKGNGAVYGTPPQPN